MQICMWAELPTQICVSHLNQRWFEFDWSSIENRPVTHHIIRWVPVWTFHRTSVVTNVYNQMLQVNPRSRIQVPFSVVVCWYHVRKISHLSHFGASAFQTYYITQAYFIGGLLAARFLGHINLLIEFKRTFFIDRVKHMSWNAYDTQICVGSSVHTQICVSYPFP